MKYSYGALVSGPIMLIVWNKFTNQSAIPDISDNMRHDCGSCSCSVSHRTVISTSGYRIFSSYFFFCPTFCCRPIWNLILSAMDIPDMQNFATLILKMLDC